jgi:NTP pyrophosphatase (non-canonical NTP hydrolase)
MEQLIEQVKQWAYDRNLEQADPAKQLLKLSEEVGELSGAYIKQNLHGVIDGIGDTLVVLIILCLQLQLPIEYCLEAAYQEIKDRRGKTVAGVFVKDEVTNG